MRKRTQFPSLTPDVMSSYVTNWPLSNAAKTQLNSIAERKRRISEMDAQLTETGSEITELGRDQDSLRQNITTLQPVSGQQEQVQRYSRQLGDDETKLAALRDQQKELRKRRQALEAEVASLIDRLEF